MSEVPNWHKKGHCVRTPAVVVVVVVENATAGEAVSYFL